MGTAVKELSSQLFVCEMTIRRDLSEMEKCGYLNRYNGGAVLSQSEGFLPIEARMKLHDKEKKLLSDRIEKHLKDDMTVYVDSSSTCLHVIPVLARFKNVKMVTNSVLAVLTAAKYHVPCTVCGGRYFERDMCLVGSIAESALNDINADAAFFSARGVSADGLITDDDEAQTAVRKVVLKNCPINVFLFVANLLFSLSYSHLKLASLLLALTPSLEIILSLVETTLSPFSSFLEA